MKFTERSSCRLTLKRNSIHCVNVHFSTKYIIVHLDEIEKESSKCSLFLHCVKLFGGQKRHFLGTFCVGRYIIFCFREHTAVP